VTASESNRKSDITKLTLYELGLSGGNESKKLRERLQKSLGLPSLMSSGSLVEVLNTMMNSSELAEYIENIKEKDDVI
ncbi:MAG: DUF4093 domain-containing protein, partial [Ruminococcus sp.]|nr:DUF4093 domain-containing protein [Ruminococcus sp.]